MCQCYHAKESCELWLTGWVNSYWGSWSLESNEMIAAELVVGARRLAPILFPLSTLWHQLKRYIQTVTNKPQQLTSPNCTATKTSLTADHPSHPYLQSWIQPRTMLCCPWSWWACSPCWRWGLWLLECSIGTEPTGNAWAKSGREARRSVRQKPVGWTVMRAPSWWTTTGRTAARRTPTTWTTTPSHCP